MKELATPERARVGVKTINKVLKTVIGLKRKYELQIKHELGWNSEKTTRPYAYICA